MSRMNRRRFTWVATGGVASATLVACGDAVDEDLTPTRISEVIGAPPTLAPLATPFESEEVEEEADAPEPDAPEDEAEADGDGEEADVVVDAGTEPITLEAEDPYNWSTYELEAAPGQEIVVVNTGSLQHDFVVDEWELATELLNGGAEETVTVPEDAEVGSQVVYYCSVPGHREAGMEGTLTVVEGGGGEAAAAEEEPVEEEPAEEAAAAGPAEALTIAALDALQFDPSEAEVTPGQEIHVINEGSLQHDLVVDEWEMATAILNGGEEETITVPEDVEIGSQVVFYCSVPGHRPAGMEGTFTVVEGGAAVAEEATE